MTNAEYPDLPRVAVGAVVILIAIGFLGRIMGAVGAANVIRGAWTLRLAAFVGLALLVVVAYLPALDAGYIIDDDNYVHAEFRSRIFRFVDDVEFFFDEADSVVHFRSAARTGYSDMGVNRKRMEEIRTHFDTAP